MEDKFSDDMNDLFYEDNGPSEPAPASGNGGNGYYETSSAGYQNTTEQTGYSNYSTFSGPETEPVTGKKEPKDGGYSHGPLIVAEVLLAFTVILLGIILVVVLKKFPQQETEEAVISSAPTVVYHDANDVSDIVESAMDSIVSITSTKTYQEFNFFSGYQSYNAKTGGSGIIIGKDDENLYIVTNNHVVKDTEDLTVQFIDETSATATINGQGTDSDVAVITVKLKDLTDETLGKIRVASLHTEDDLKVGNQVLAIGNALGYGQSLTVGYISALNRTIRTEEGVNEGLIQTDAAINPGNSGGALLNMNGEVIGINVAKYSSTSVEGIGYSIPISKISDLIENLSMKKYDEDERGYIGIQCTSVDSDTSALYNMPQGVYIYKVTSDKAKESGLMEHDIITAINGYTVSDSKNLSDYLAGYQKGETVTVTVQRLKDGEFTEVEISVPLTSKEYNETETP